MSFDRKMIALAAAVADLESPAELLAGVELLAAHAGRLDSRDRASENTRVPRVVASKLGGALVEFRKAFWEVERLAVPDMSDVDGGAGGDSPSGQLTALLPLVQGISYPEVAMRIVEEIGTLATQRMRGQWSPLWWEVRGRVSAALAANGAGAGRFVWRNGAFEVVESRLMPLGKIGVGVATNGTVKGVDFAINTKPGPGVVNSSVFREPPGWVPAIAVCVNRVEDQLGHGVIVTQEGHSWRLVAQETTIMLCVPGPEEFMRDALAGSVVPWWVTSMDCRRSKQWEIYLSLFEEFWPGVYKGPREADRGQGNGN